MKNKIIYSIDITDIETVTQELFDRSPTKEEIDYLERELGEFIDWFGGIENALNNCKLAK